MKHIKIMLRGLGRLAIGFMIAAIAAAAATILVGIGVGIAHFTDAATGVLSVFGVFFVTFLLFIAYLAGDVE